MQRNAKHTLINRILAGLLTSLLWTAAQAGEPLWIIFPAPGNNPTQTVPYNSTSTMQYVVQNQSYKPKRVVIQSMSGIVQTSPCQLMPKGQPGSSCTLNLVITGSALPKAGIHGGPGVCETNPDDSPNLGQCFLPNVPEHTLNISKGAFEKAGLAVSPAALDLLAESSTPGFLTITNNSIGLTALNVQAILPAKWADVTQDASNCIAIAPNGGTCQLQFTPGLNAHIPITVPIVGSNTTRITAQLSVSEPEYVSLMITGAPITLVAGCPTVGVVTVTNTSLTVTATNISAYMESMGNDVSAANNCPSSLPPGQSCTFNLTGINPRSTSFISIRGNNTSDEAVLVTVNTALAIGNDYLDGMVFEVDACNIGKVVSNGIGPVYEQQSQWSSQYALVTTDTDANSGASNTDNIIGSIGCNDANDCAALACRNIGGNWYLPSKDELLNIAATFCTDGLTCYYNWFSSTSYWSSSQLDISNSWGVAFPSGIPSAIDASNVNAVRCVTAFTS